MNLTEFERILECLVQNPEGHRKWLNTLSCMENCGARKILATQNPQTVSLKILKHAAEETRHAFFFKNLIKRLGNGEEGVEDFSLSKIWCGSLSKNYIHRLDVKICRYLKNHYGRKWSPSQLKEAAYLLTTYGIEVRAMAIYPLYEKILEKSGTGIGLRGVIYEETQHLKEMEEDLQYLFEDWKKVVDDIKSLEHPLFLQWEKRLREEIRQNF